MGVFGRLFGKGGDRSSGEARCNDCGMTAGRHTDWCPLGGSEEDAVSRSARQGEIPPDRAADTTS